MPQEGGPSEHDMADGNRTSHIAQFDFQNMSMDMVFFQMSKNKKLTCMSYYYYTDYELHLLYSVASPESQVRLVYIQIRDLKRDSNQTITQNLCSLITFTF